MRALPAQRYSCQSAEQCSACTVYMQDVNLSGQQAELAQSAQREARRDVHSVEGDSSIEEIAQRHVAAVLRHGYLWSEMGPVQAQCQVTHVNRSAAAR